MAGSLACPTPVPQSLAHMGPERQLDECRETVERSRPSLCGAAGRLGLAWQPDPAFTLRGGPVVALPAAGGAGDVAALRVVVTLTSIGISTLPAGVNLYRGPT